MILRPPRWINLLSDYSDAEFADDMDKYT